MACDTLLIFQLSTAREALPVSGAQVTVTDPETGQSRTQMTNTSGRTAPLCLTAPAAALTFVPESTVLPYKKYSARIEAEGYFPVLIEGIQMFSGQESLQEVEMIPAGEGRSRAGEEVRIEIPENALRQTREKAPEGFRGDPQILGEVFVPAYITVHLGTPDNTSARNVAVSFPDYIKNVASSEIYPTWPESALRANILAQITFAQNRVFTEWYPSRGYAFDITNNTNYDQFYVYGRNIFATISRLVDDIFDQYVRRQGVINPLFTEYCNGTTVTCAGLSQWGSVTLANNGFTPLGILKNYYGNNIEIAAANATRAIASSYPGTALRVGSRSDAVRTIETQLNRIRQNYPAIPAITGVDNSYTTETETAARAFQRIFNLSPDGIVGRATWNRISFVYAAVLRLAELGGEGIPLPDERPAAVLRLGSTGDEVRLAQYLLRVVAQYYARVEPIEIDGIFGSATQQQVINFQRLKGLTPDGIIGRNTWNALYDAFFEIAETTGLRVPYPGTLLKQGSRGSNVRLMQEYLNAIAGAYPLPSIVADGVYGSRTANAVSAFQRLFGLVPDGIIGPLTWERIVAVRLLVR